MRDGKGTALNTLLDVFIPGMIGNIMNLKGVQAYPQQVIKGVIIIPAVLLQGIQSLPYFQTRGSRKITAVPLLDSRTEWRRG